MTYAQKDYDQIQGNNGQNTIAEIGSLLTAFSNLLDRFGEGVDPTTLNAAFAEDNIYLYKTDEVRDRLALSSISAYDSTIGISGIGQGVPPTHNAIVKLTYQSALTGGQVSTYALVADNVAGTIIDSFDGVEKSWDVYGGPVEWYSYKQFEAITITPLKAQAPQPEEPKQPETYVVDEETKGAKTIDDADAHNLTIDVRPGSYYVGDETSEFVYIIPHVGADFGAWLIKPAADQPEEPSDDGFVRVPVKVNKVDPLAWQKSYAPNLGVVNYVTVRDMIVHDYAVEHTDKNLKADTVVPVAGHFEIDGISFARTKKSAEENVWYGIPTANLKREDDNNDPTDNTDEIDNQLDDLLNSDDATLRFDLGDDRLTPREKVIKMGATVDGTIKKVTNKLSLGKK